MVGLVIFILVVGAAIYGLSYTRFFEGLGRQFLKWLGLGVMTLGAMIVFSVLYVNYTPVFYGISFALGLLLVVLGLRAHEGSGRKLLHSGAGCLVAGILMVVVKSGWFLFFALLAVVALLYFKFGYDERVKRVITTLKEKLS